MMTGLAHDAQIDHRAASGQEAAADQHAQPEHSLPDSPSVTASASPDLFDNLRTRSKSLSDLGQHLLKQLAKNSVSRLTELPAANSVINMTTNNQTLVTNSSNRANELFRQQLPGITKKILGKRFDTVNKVANLIMPAGSFDKVSDQILELLADFASTVSGTEHITGEAGVKTLAELQGDTARSGRLARALNEKNRYIGMAQGAVSGATGVAGAAADIPLSMILALRTVYLTGRAYGFELNKPQDRTMIFEALSNADLSLITEKQAILLGLNSVSGMLSTGNIQGLQTLLGSGNDFDPLFKLLSDSNGQLKWKISAALINKVTPVVGGAVGAIYTSRLLKGVAESAKQVFEHARQQQGISDQSTTQQLNDQSAGKQGNSQQNAEPASVNQAQANQTPSKDTQADKADTGNNQAAQTQTGESKADQAKTSPSQAGAKQANSDKSAATVETKNKADSQAKDGQTKDSDVKDATSSDKQAEKQTVKQATADQPAKTKSSAQSKPEQASKPASQSASTEQGQHSAQQEAQQALQHNDDITKVEVSTRREHDAQQLDASSRDEQIHDQLSKLAHDLIDESAEPAKSSKPAATEEQAETGSKKTARGSKAKTSASDSIDVDASSSTKH